MKCGTDCLREKLARGETLFGSHTSWGGGMIPEMYGTAGYDMVWIDTEHGTINPLDVQNALIGARAGGLCAFVRIPWHDPVMAKPILDLGADGIVFPMIVTKENAEEAVAACRYPLEGRRGYGPFRAMRYGAVGAKDYIETESRKVWVIAQIEHIDAVANLDAILSVRGIDAIVTGPCDLSGSMGLLGQTNHPEVKKAMDIVAEKTKAAGIPFGVSMIWDEEAVTDWVRRGASMMFCDNEGSYIMRGSRDTLAKMKKAFEK